MKGNVDAVYCEFKYSGVAVAVLGLCGVATALIVLMGALSTPLSVALIALIVPMTLRAIRRASAVHSLCLGGDLQVRVTFAVGRELAGKARGGSFVAPWLTLVRWRPDGAWFDRTLLVLPGMLDPGDFRRLRVQLRWR